MKNVEEYRMEIVSGQYAEASAQQQDMIGRLFGKNAEYKYEIYFHWYNLMQELGHAVMMFHALSRPHPAEEEQLVNHFAVSYWRQYGEPEKMKTLRALVEETLPKFRDPTQNTASYMEYAKRVWGQEEFYNFNNYGWFQFQCVKNAILQNEDLGKVLYRMTSLGLQLPERKVFSYDVDATMAFRVVEDAAAMLNCCGITLPRQIQVMPSNDLNVQMCRAVKLE